MLHNTKFGDIFQIQIKKQHIPSPTPQYKVFESVQLKRGGEIKVGRAHMRMGLAGKFGLREVGKERIGESKGQF